jgi:ribosome biogenesis protein MAK21
MDSDQVDDSQLMIKLNEKWFKQKILTNQTDTTKRLPRDKELALKREAEQLLATDTAAYKKSLNSGMRKSEFDWIWNVLKTGALADKLSANSLLNQDSAVHNLSSLRTMLQLCQSKGKREFLLASEHLKELLIADVMPPFKLRHFGELVSSMPHNPTDRSVHLILSYYEDQLKFLYKDFIDTIERMSHDAVIATKNKAIYMMYELLSNRPEQEQLLLSHLANKLGDPCPKAAAHALHLLDKLVTSDHPAMKEVVVQEVERVLFRANIKERAQYRCLCLFQGLRLSLADQSLANRLMEIYFSFFTKCIRAGDVNNKTMSVILSGVTRALPFSSMGKAAVRKHMDTFYRLVHVVNTGIAIQVFVLMLQVVSSPSNRNKKQNSSSISDDSGKGSEQLIDRFLSSLYRFLLKQDLFESSSRMPVFFNLLFRALKFDEHTCRTFAFVKRLLQVSLFVCVLVTFSFTVFFCCHIYQVSCNSTPPIAAAVMYLVSELLKNKKALFQVFHAEQSRVMESAADESPADKKDRRKRKQRKMRTPEKQAEPVSVCESGASEAGYQVNARNPLFAHSEKTSAWEMRFLTHHYHPSVSSFAESVTARKFVDYDGDPLNDFSLKHFLDRFVHKKPKEREHEKEADDNDSVNSEEFEQILRKSERNLQGDDDDVEWEDLSDDEWRNHSNGEDHDEEDGETDDELFDDDDDEMGDLFDSDDDLSDGGFSDAFGSDDDNQIGDADSLFAPAEDVEQDEDGNFVIREKIGADKFQTKRRKAGAKVPSKKRLKRN